NSLRENVRERFWRHHSAGERINPSLTGSGIVNCLGVQNKRAQLIEQLQSRQLTAPHQSAAIVDVGNLCAQSADVDWEIENFLTPKFVKHRQDFLRFTEREHRNENATAARERVLDRLRKALLLARTRPACGNRRVPASAFHDQDVDPPPVRLGLGKNRRLRDRLIIKVYIAGVKQ